MPGLPTTIDDRGKDVDVLGGVGEDDKGIVERARPGQDRDRRERQLLDGEQVVLYISLGDKRVLQAGIPSQRAPNRLSVPPAISTVAASVFMYTKLLIDANV